MGTALRTAGGTGAKNQPVAIAEGNQVLVVGDNNYGSAKYFTYTDDFILNPSGGLICMKNGSYKVQATAFFRYGCFYVRKNNETVLTVNGWTTGDGGNVTTEGDVELSEGDVLTVSTSLSGASTTFASGGAFVFRK